MIDLTGKHIFIAGGGRGIGAEAARMLAGAGASVSLNYPSNCAAAEGIVRDIAESGGRAALCQADVAEEGALDEAIARAVEELGPLHGLVVSAGIFEGKPLEEMTVEFWERTMSINVRGTFLAVRAVVPHLCQTGQGGSIVIYASTAGQRGSAIYSAYATSKGAQIMFMRSMALELAPNRIRVNCIAPAWTDTEMAAPSFEQIGRDKIASNFPLGRIGLPADVAGATCFLQSDLAAFVTGSTITVDGGMDMRG